MFFLSNIINFHIPNFFLSIFSNDKNDKSRLRKNQAVKIIVDFLQRCGIPYQPQTVDETFTALCSSYAESLGYDMNEKSKLRPYIPSGVAIAITAYAHLPEQTRILIALYTAFLICLDDLSQHGKVSDLKEFNERFVSGRRQSDKLLDDFAALLLTIPKYYRHVEGNIIITATLNFVTALLIENETLGIPIPTSAITYPGFFRTLSGSADAYALFVFPASIPAKFYIHAHADIATYLNNGNDVLSFYKEEQGEETDNYVSLLAQCHRSSKLEAIRRIADEAVDAHLRVLEILKPHKDAYDAYRSFSCGYIGFHTSLSRYRLDELEIK